MSRWLGSALLSVIFLSLSVSVGEAQAASAEIEAATRSAASEHFRLGVELFREGAFAAALAELERAHQLVPDYRVHYNIAQTELALSDYVAARASFERYLDEGGVLVEPRRRREIEAELVELSRRMGKLRIDVDSGAEISIDGVVVGTAPLSAARLLSIGRHTVAAQRADGARASETVHVAGGDDKQVRLQLALPAPIPAQQAVLALDAPPIPLRLERRTRWGIGLLGAGVALGLSAGALWLTSRELRDDYEATHRERTRRRADAFVLTAEIGGAAGAVLTATSIVLFLTVLSALTSPDRGGSSRADARPSRRSASWGVGLGALAFTQRF